MGWAQVFFVFHNPGREKKKEKEFHDLCFFCFPIQTGTYYVCGYLFSFCWLPRNAAKKAFSIDTPTLQIHILLLRPLFPVSCFLSAFLFLPLILFFRSLNLVCFLSSILVFLHLRREEGWRKWQKTRVYSYVGLLEQLCES